jgi:hypothetical protein
MLDTLLFAASLWLTPAAPLSTSPPVPVNVPVGLDSWVRPEVWTVPVYKAARSDPQAQILFNPNAWYKVAMGEWQRSGNRAEVEAEILGSSSPVFPFRGNVFSSTSATTWQLPTVFNEIKNVPGVVPTMILPKAALPAPGPDGHMAVHQPNGDVVETFATIRLSSGQVAVLSYSRNRSDRMGDGHENGQTASMLPAYLGLITEDELKSGRIAHAMAITVPSHMLTPAVAYPAYAFDRGAMTETPRYAGTLPMGSRLAMSATAQPDALGLQTPEGKVIARAAKEFGFFVVDRGGEGISLRVLRNPSGRPNKTLRNWNWGLDQDLKKIFQNLVWVPQPGTAAAAKDR